MHSMALVLHTFRVYSYEGKTNRRLVENVFILDVFCVGYLRPAPGSSCLLIPAQACGWLCRCFRSAEGQGVQTNPHWLCAQLQRDWM